MTGVKGMDLRRGFRIDVRGAEAKGGARRPGCERPKHERGVYVPIEVVDERPNDGRAVDAAGGRDGVHEVAPANAVPSPEGDLPPITSKNIPAGDQSPERSERVACDSGEVAGADVQGLLARLEEREREVAELRARLAGCEAELVECRARLEGVDDYVGRLREQDRDAIGAGAAKLREGMAETSKSYRSFREEMSEGANAWQREICGQFRALEDRLEATRQGLYQSVRSWREEMFKGEFREIGYSYRRFVSILGKIEEANARRVSSGEEEFPEGERLRKWLVEYEAALASIGLEVVRPLAGTPFDPDQEVLDLACRREGGLDEDEDLIICGCVLPGLGYRRSEDDELVVVAPPIVTARRP